MTNPFRFARLIVVLVALLIGDDPAKGNGFDLNHYVLGCGDFCPRFINSAVASGGIDATFTGSWYDPAQSGHGLFLEVLPDHRAMALWFTFDPAGRQQAWLAGTGIYTGNVVTFDSVAMPTGGRWILNFDATKIVENTWGTMTLSFDGYDHGRVEYKSVLGYGTGSMELARLTRPAGITTAAVTAKGQWVSAGSPNVARYGHTSTLLDNGKVLVAGGLDNVGVTDSAELYDPSTRTWSAIAPLPDPRVGHTATKLPDGKVLILGGEGIDYPEARAALFDPETNTWSSFLSPGWASHSATLLRTGKVLLVGIANGYHTYNVENASLFDPATRTWSPTGGGFDNRLGATATLLKDGRVLLTGGSIYDDETGCGAVLGTQQTYDPVTDSWSTGGSPDFFSFGRHTTTLLPDGRVLVVGMTNDGIVCGNPMPPVVTQLYDPATGLWMRGGETSGYRERHSASLLPDGRVLVAGGRGQLTADCGGSSCYPVFHSLDSAEIYDPRTRSWSTTTPLITPRADYTTNRSDLLQWIIPRADHTATVLPDGHVLVVEGCCGSGDVTATGHVNGPKYRGGSLPPPKRGAELYGTDFAQGSIVPAMTGAWFDPAQKGHGLLVEVLPYAQLLVWWFGFNTAGTEQAWFGGLGTYTGNTASIAAVDQPTGSRFIPNFDPTKIVHNPWGSLTLTFTDCDHGKVDFASTAPGYGSGSMNLTRLTRPAGLACP